MICAVPTGFEPATSALTGRRALQTAPRDLIATPVAGSTAPPVTERRCPLDWRGCVRLRRTEVSLYAIRAQTPISSACGNGLCQTVTEVWTFASAPWHGGRRSSGLMGGPVRYPCT